MINTEVKVKVDNTAIDETIEKANQLLELLREVQEKIDLLSGNGSAKQMMLDCLALHLKYFFYQSCDDKVANFGEPCGNCHNFEKCHGNWLDVLDPLLRKSNIRISVVGREH